MNTFQPYTPDETPYGAWAWLILFLWVNAYWIGFDLWARSHNHQAGILTAG
jgi:hypothetical protein